MGSLCSNVSLTTKRKRDKKKVRVATLQAQIHEQSLALAAFIYGKHLL